MKRILLGILLICIWLIAGCSSEQQVDKKHVIGVLQFTKNNITTLEGFTKGLESHGFIDGKNIEIVNYGIAKNIDEIPEIFKKLALKKPDIIFSSTTPASISAYKLSKNTGIQVVFAPVNDPVAAGIIKSIKSPGEHISGVRLSNSDAKRLEWITKLSSDVKKVLIPYNMADKSPKATLKKLHPAAKKLGIELVEFPVSNHTEIDNLLASIPSQIQAIYLPRDGMVMSRIKDFSVACNRDKKILSTPRYDQVLQGATTGYGFIGFEIGKQAARIAAQILNGTPAGDIPVETAEDYLFVNKDSLQKIELTVDDYILRQAYSKDK